MNRNYEGNALTAEMLEKVNGGYWCPPDGSDDTLPGIPSITDGINDNGVYIGVNVPGVNPTGCVGPRPILD